MLARCCYCVNVVARGRLCRLNSCVGVRELFQSISISLLDAGLTALVGPMALARRSAGSIAGDDAHPTQPGRISPPTQVRQAALRQTKSLQRFQYPVEGVLGHDEEWSLSARQCLTRSDPDREASCAELSGGQGDAC